MVLRDFYPLALIFQPDKITPHFPRFDPKPNKIVNKLPLENSFCAHFQSAELEPYRTDSEFWNWYEQSESTGEILVCENLEENLWLGKDSSIWEFVEQ